MRSPFQKLALLLLAVLIGIGLFLFRSEKSARPVLNPAASQPAIVGTAPLLPTPAAEPVSADWPEEMRTLRELAAQKPKAALSQAISLSLKEDRETAVREVCMEIARRDPAQALDAAWRFGVGKPDAAVDDAALEKLGERCAATDLDVTLAWLRAQPAEDRDDRRDRAIKGIATALAKTAPRGAADLVAGELPEGSHQWQAALEVIAEWARHDVSGATAWVESFPAGALRDTASQTLASASPVQ